MDEEIREAIANINHRLDGINGVFDDFQQLLNNHMTDYTSKFGEMKAGVEASEKVVLARAETTDAKVDTFKWALKLVGSFTGISLAGLLALAGWALYKAIGG